MYKRQDHGAIEIFNRLNDMTAKYPRSAVLTGYELGPVSYTHLDVYKRQVHPDAEGREAHGKSVGQGDEGSLGRAVAFRILDVYKRQDIFHRQHQLDRIDGLRAQVAVQPQVKGMHAVHPRGEIGRASCRERV